MALTVMGMGTKQAPAGVNLDPQKQFWSHLSAYINKESSAYNSTNSRVGYISGFECRQNTQADMTILIGGGNAPDSAVMELADNRMVLISTDGTPQRVTIPTAPSSGTRIDAVVSYVDISSASPDSETPGTPSYIKTIVVKGSSSAPDNSAIVAALPASAGGQYYRWCDVTLTANQNIITNSSISNRKPSSPNVYFTKPVFYSINLGTSTNLGTITVSKPGTYVIGANIIFNGNGQAGGDDGITLDIDGSVVHQRIVSTVGYFFSLSTTTIKSVKKTILFKWLHVSGNAKIETSNNRTPNAWAYRIGD